MDPLVIVLIVLVVIALVAAVAEGSRAREQRRESRRIEASEHRAEAQVRGARADAQAAEAEERAARARREQAKADAQAALARNQREIATSASSAPLVWTRTWMSTSPGTARGVVARAGKWWRSGARSRSRAWRRREEQDGRAKRGPAALSGAPTGP